MPKFIDRPKPQPVAAQPPTSAAQPPLEAPDAPELTERQRELLAYLRSRMGMFSSPLPEGYVFDRADAYPDEADPA